MKYLFIVAVAFLSGSSVQAQISESDTTLIVYAPSIFSYTCIDKLSLEYGVSMSVAPQGCYQLPAYSTDSIEWHNKRVEAYHAARLGENWVSWMKGQLHYCENTLCNPDSVKNYYHYGSYLMTPGSDSINATHYCICDNTILYWMRTYENMKIEIMSYALPGEESLSAARANSFKQYMVSKGVAPQRIRIVDMGSGETIAIDPMSRINCSITFKVVEY